MKLHYQSRGAGESHERAGPAAPERPDIIPGPFRRLARPRRRWRHAVLLVLVLLVAGVVAWIWLRHRDKQTIKTQGTTLVPRQDRVALLERMPLIPGGQGGQQTKDEIAPGQQASGTSSAHPVTPASATALPETDPDDGIRLQVALARRGFSPGAIDGIVGPQTRAALRAFQKSQTLRPTGAPDAVTRARLGLHVPEAAGGHVYDQPAAPGVQALDMTLYASYTITTSDVARLRPLGRSWLAKSRQDRLEYQTILELVAEKAQSHEDLVWRLNPEIDWRRLRAGAAIKVPNVQVSPPPSRAASIRIFLTERALQVFDAEDRILVHFPCSIGERVEKRPTGALYITSIAPNPNYTFDPAIFPESSEAQALGRKLILQPGPNNPVGTVWIGLDRPGYGIHGTPQPEKVGRTESHGCFRLANWNAEHLLNLAWVGMPVYVHE